MRCGRPPASGAQDQACLAQALQQDADPARVAASLAPLAIKPGR